MQKYKIMIGYVREGRALSHSSSHFGSPIIEGLVVKNYDTQKFGKWVNNEFEDMLRLL